MFETLIAGGGPAGMGALIYAARQGKLRDWLDRGVVLIDANERLGGSIGRYALNADSAAGMFLECLDGDPASPLAALKDDPVTRTLAADRHGLPPLPLVGLLINNVGEMLAREIARHPRSRFLGGTQVRGLQLVRDGSVRADLVVPGGSRHTVRAASVMLALGGRQITDWNAFQLAPGVRLDRWRAKLLPSDVLLGHDGAASARRALRRAGSATPRVVILGGAHSAFSAAWALLERLGGTAFAEGGLHILHRGAPRIFYATPAEAAADDYRFEAADICPATGRINRLGGLRGDGREVWRRLHGLTGAPADRRAKLLPLAGMSPIALRNLLDAADLIVPAFGYRLASVPVFGPNGCRLALATTGPAVDADSRLRLADGRSLANVLGVGLGSGFRPWGAMAGEPSFQGQQNSLWLYQNGLGEMLHDATQRWAQERRAPAATAGPAWGGFDVLSATARYCMARLL